MPQETIHELVARLDSETQLLGAGHAQTLASANRLAVAFWCAGEVDQAITLLEQSLDGAHSADGLDHPVRADLLSTLGEIMFDQRHLEQAGAIQREVLAYHLRHKGTHHPKSLAAQGDLAAVLFEQGNDEEAAGLQQQAFEGAREYLGKTHPVTCVLAWNCALDYERCGDADSARRVISGELLWLLAEDTANLEEHQRTVRHILAERLNWDAARTC